MKLKFVLPVFAFGLFLAFGAKGDDRAESVLSKVCQASGVYGTRGLHLSIRDDSASELQKWIDREKPLALNSPSLLVDFDKICFKGSGCGSMSPWRLSMYPSARIRKEALFQAAHIMEWRARAKKLPESWEDLEAAVTQANFFDLRYSATAKQRLENVVENVRSKSAKLTPLGDLVAEQLCWVAQEKSHCFKFVKFFFEQFQAAPISEKTTGLNYSVIGLELAMPSVIKEVLEDSRYGQALQLFNVAAIKKAVTYENLLVTHAAPEKVVQISGSLESDLRSAVRFAFSCSKNKCLDHYTQTLLLFYGIRGASFSPLLDYLASDYYPFFLQYAVFSTVINLLDAEMQELKLTSQGFYTVPEKELGSCLPSKPYHYILPLVTAERGRELSRNSLALAQGIYLNNVLYQFAIHSPELRNKPSEFQLNTSSLYNRERLDLIFSSLAIARGLHLKDVPSPMSEFLRMNQVSSDSVENIGVTQDSPPNGLSEKVSFRNTVGVARSEIQFAHSLGFLVPLRDLETLAK